MYVLYILYLCRGTQHNVCSTEWDSIINHNHTTHKNKNKNALFCEEKHDVVVSLATSGRCTFLLLTRQFELFLFTLRCRWWWKWQQIWSRRLQLQPRPTPWCCSPRHGRSRPCKGFERNGRRCAAETRCRRRCCQTQRQRTTGLFPIVQEWREGIVKFRYYFLCYQIYIFFLTTSDESNERLGRRTRRRMYDGNKIIPRDMFIMWWEIFFYVSIYFCCQGLITYTTHKITDNQLWKSLWRTSKRLDAACRNEGNYGHISWLNAFVLKLYCSEKVMNSNMPCSQMFLSLNLQWWGEQFDRC